MMIGIVSDTHGDSLGMRNSLNALRGVQFIIHLGDVERDAAYYERELGVPVVGVCGNCDLFPIQPSERIIDIGGKKALLTHGHKYRVKHGLTPLMLRAKEAQTDIVCFGHTHLSLVEMSGGILFINPGSLSRPTRGKRSVCLLNDSTLGADIIPV